VPKNKSEAEMLCDRISARLQHINPSVVLGTIKVLVNWIEQVKNGKDAILQKIVQPLGTNLIQLPCLRLSGLSSNSLCSKTSK